MTDAPEAPDWLDSFDPSDPRNLPEPEDQDKWWDARLDALQNLFGAVDDLVGHAVTPFDFRDCPGAAADLVYFRNHIPGVVTVTAELIGRDDQLENSLGNYELAICHRDGEEWGPNLIALLANYTRDAILEPGHTMDIAERAPNGSTITALFFQEFARFSVLGRQAGILLCIGITSEELSACRSGKAELVERLLKERGIHPYTDLYRQTLLPKRRKWGWS
jgi:hypothetical protein